MGLPLRWKRRRRSKAPEIPMDVVMDEILTRLPAKSLMRFKCVSKLWSSLISSRYFTNRFLTVSSSRPHPRHYMCLLDRDDYSNSVILSAAPDTTSPSSFVVDQELTIPEMGGYISQNHYGFICYKFLKKGRIYNPTTRQLVTLPALKSSIIDSGGPNNMTPQGLVRYYFGHDPINNQYKVIGSIFETRRISEQCVFVLVLKPGGSWRKVDFCPHVPVKVGLSINGFLYYLAWTGIGTLAAMCNYVVVSFDIRSEEFKMIQLPHKDGETPDIREKKLSLVEYGAKVTVFDYTHLRGNGMVDLWVLEDAKNKEWSRKTLVLQPSQMHLVNNIFLRVNSTAQNGKVILIPEWDSLSPFQVFCYDLQSNDMRRFEIKGIPDHWFSKVKRVDFMFMDESESITYLET